MRIHVLALDGVFDTGLATVLDAFHTANELAGISGLSSAPFDVTIVGVRKAVKTAQGLTVPVTAIPKRIMPDWVIVPAIGFKMPDALEAALTRSDVSDAGDALRSWLLDNQDSTTTWWLAPLFRRRYPNVRLDESRMIVKSGKYVTAGAALSHMDLALWLIRQKSPKLAALSANYLIVDARPSQSAYILSDHLAHSDPVVERFESWARRRLAQGFSLDAAAEAAGSSKRTLARRMQAVLGKSPLAYFQELRVERAVHLLKTTDASVDAIAGRVGYADGVTLRTLLRRRIGRGIKEIRRSAP
jgi:transcriptional regulator GlxA family with amidase domain